MASLFNVAMVMLFASGMALTQEQSPMTTVINLISDLRDKVVNEGKDEAESYEKFACFCKQNTVDASGHLQQGKSDVDTSSATIEEKTADLNKATVDLAAKIQQKEDKEKEMSEAKAAEDKAEADFQKYNADMSKATNALKEAIAAIPQKGNFLQLSDSLEKALALVKPAHRQTISALIDQAQHAAPSDPGAKFVSHSTDLVALLKKLKDEFEGELKTVSGERSKARKAHNDYYEVAGGLVSELGLNIGTLKEDVDTFKGEIADARESLLAAQTKMQDDKAFLSDLTTTCESRAQEFDQRAKARAGEIKALSGALDVLTGKAAALDAKVNDRVVDAVEPTTFLQTRRVHAHGRKSFLARELTVQEKRERALGLLEQAGKTFGSTALITLAARGRADPFLKVKDLIQKLIERLIKEATDEASKKGFCDTEMKKSENNRDARMGDVNRLLLQIEALEDKKDALAESVQENLQNSKTANKNLNEAKSQREQRHGQNLRDLADAKEGLKAVKEAIGILRQFYKQANKNEVGSVDIVDSSSLGRTMKSAEVGADKFAGAYKGDQKSSTAIFGMLEVIQTDFERTIRTTEASEKKDHKDSVQFERTSSENIAQYDTQHRLSSDDLETTKSSLVKAYADLQSQMDLVDSAVKGLVDLQDLCVDTGMSYAERTKQREQEMQQLRNAFCILCPSEEQKPGGDAECNSVDWCQ